MATGFGIFALGWLVPPLAERAGRGVRCEPGVHGDVASNLARNWPATTSGSAGRAIGGWSASTRALACWAAWCAGWAPPRRWCLGLLAGWMAVGTVAVAVRPRDRRSAGMHVSVGGARRGRRRRAARRPNAALRRRSAGLADLARPARWPAISGRAASRIWTRSSSRTPTPITTTPLPALLGSVLAWAWSTFRR